MDADFCKYNGICAEGGNSDSTQELESFLTPLKECKEAVQDDLSSCKFNNKQCEYLAGKLEVAVQDASSFIEVFRAKHHGPCPSEDVAKWVEIFKLVLTLAKQIGSFVRRCCDDAWVQAAMTLTGMSEYVSSLGFNVELCRIAFAKECAALSKEPAAHSKESSVIQGPTSVELADINKTEAEIVKIRASVDYDTLSREVRMGSTSFCSETKDLAFYLLQRLAEDEPCATLDNGSYLNTLYKWVTKADKQLGRGATGTVFEATWLGIPVAKKTFDGPDNPHFLKEVEILSPLRHPNIMSMFCCTKTERSCSIVMELMDGDLYALLRRRSEENSGSPPFPILESVDIMLQAGEGVDYLHSKKIVHRDLKSGNILVKVVKGKELETPYIHAKVADFGLSKTKECTVQLSKFAENAGTDRWMPPEVIKLSPSLPRVPSESNHQPSYPFKCDTFKCDTYSFAMVCYEILTGYLPFEKEKYNGPRLIKEKILEGIRPKLPEDPKDCPPMLKALIERCWSPEPKERPRFGFICSQLRFLKYLLMTGTSLNPT
jgi:hypothetical protein